MVNTSTRPITVDGVRLDTLAWNVTAIRRAVAARRNLDQDVPGVDGVVPSLNDTLEPASYGLDMFVRGTNADGYVTSTGSQSLFRQNLDELVHLFGTRHRLLDLREQVDASGTQRRAWAKVVDTITPDVNENGTVGTFTVGMVLPYGVWEDVATQDWAVNQPGASVQEVTTLQGSTERITDALVAVLGPITNPRVTDSTTGAYVQYFGTVTSAQAWVVDCSTWASRIVTDRSNPMTASGTSVIGATTYGGAPGAGSMLTLTPVRDGSTRRVRVTLGGTSTSSITWLSIRARRKYAL